MLSSRPSLTAVLKLAHHSIFHAPFQDPMFRVSTTLSLGDNAALGELGLARTWAEFGNRLTVACNVLLYRGFHWCCARQSKPFYRGDGDCGFLPNKLMEKTPLVPHQDRICISASKPLDAHSSSKKDKGRKGTALVLGACTSSAGTRKRCCCWWCGSVVVWLRTCVIVYLRGCVLVCLCTCVVAR